MEESIVAQKSCQFALHTKYWINLLHDSDFIPEKTFDFIIPKIEDIICILAAIVKTTKGIKS